MMILLIIMIMIMIMIVMVTYDDNDEINYDNEISLSIEGRKILFKTRG